MVVSRVYGRVYGITSQSVVVHFRLRAVFVSVWVYFHSGEKEDLS